MKINVKTPAPNGGLAIWWLDGSIIDNLQSRWTLAASF